MNTGWIKLHRTLLDWEWYDDHNATRLLIHLLVSVNHEDKKWKGGTVKAGSMILSWESLSSAVGLSVKQCRVAMSKLEMSKEVARLVAGKWQVVSLVKWEKLQIDESDMAAYRAGKGQGKGRERATTKEYKESKEVKNIDSMSTRKKSFADALKPFVEVYGKEMIRAFFDYWTQPNKSGTKMGFEMQKTWSIEARLRTWASREPIKTSSKPVIDEAERIRKQKNDEKLAKLMSQ